MLLLKVTLFGVGLDITGQCHYYRTVSISRDTLVGSDWVSTLEKPDNRAPSKWWVPQR